MKIGYTIRDIEIFGETLAWELALAINEEKTSKIKEIIKSNPEIIDFQDPKYGATLLLWSVGKDKYKSTKALLECGANTEIGTFDIGETPLLVASETLWGNTPNNIKYVKFLLKYGADPNKPYKDTRKIESLPYVPFIPWMGITSKTPLIMSIGNGIEVTKMLVEAGVDINYKTPRFGETAAMNAIQDGSSSVSMTSTRTVIPEYAYYLIVEQKAKLIHDNDETMNADVKNSSSNTDFVAELRYWIYILDSKEYKIKMEIIDEFKKQGMDYWSTPIPGDVLKKIKDLYPTNWEEYIEKY